MNYYKQKIMIATCDKKGNMTGSIERWEAHKKGILHRAFTVALIYKGNYVLQHRKHPVFDGVFDITTSSHQIFKDGHLEDTIQAAKRALKREWKIKESNIGKFKITGAVYYKAKDEKSIYTEHEYCDIVEVKISKIPEPNLELAYGYSLIEKDKIKDTTSRTYALFAPWVKKAVEQNLI